VNALERALRNRNRILEDGQSRLDRAWADAAEQEVATLGVAVAAARHETVSRLAALIAAERDEASPFPWAAVALDGDVERLVASAPALEAEDRYRAILRDNRFRDMAAGRTTVGPHLSDLLVRHGPKGVEAARASTGEQKALLVGLVLAQAHLVAAMSNIAPIMLLDEIAAHFDPSRRAALFGRLADLGGQVFITGADPAAFAGMGPDVALLRVTPGQVAPF
jgi:DNA replication and repair protein RecF